MMSPVSSAPAFSVSVQDGAAGEVAAGPDQREAMPEIERLAVPQRDRVVGPHDPLGVLAVQVDRAVEVVRPLDHARVVVRVGDRDPGEATAVLYGFRGRVVEQCDAVPEDVAVLVRDEQRALADREVRRRADAGEVLLGPDVVVAVLLGELLECRPSLAAGRDVLTRVGADGALVRRFCGCCELGAAGGADEVVHGRRWYVVVGMPNGGQVGKAVRRGTGRGSAAIAPAAGGQRKTFTGG